MANTKKTTDTTEKKTTTATKQTDENKTIKALEAQVQALMEKIQSMSGLEPKKQENNDIYSQKIRLISLLDWPVSLSTEPYGRGVKIDFPKYGAERRVRFEDLEKMVYTAKAIADDTKTELSIFERGAVYIANQKAVAELGLDEYYENILDKSKINQIVELNDDTAISLFEGACKDTRDAIVEMMVHKINKEGKEYDLNRLAKINKMFGKDIIEIASKAPKM